LRRETDQLEQSVIESLQMVTQRCWEISKRCCARE